MRTILMAALAVFTVSFFGGSNVAEAGSKCPSNISRDACEIWLRQQTAPALKGPKAPSEPVRCVAVLSDQPSALVLRQRDNKGPAITSWRQASLGWRRTGRGYETSVCFPKRYVHTYDRLALCGAVGHSVWKEAEMTYLKSRNVGSNDPACVGGKKWCGQRGL